MTGAEPCTQPWITPLERIEAVCGAGFLTSSKGSGSTSSPASLTKSEQMKLKMKYNHLLKVWNGLPMDTDELMAYDLVGEMEIILQKLGYENVTKDEIQWGFGK